MSIRSFLQASEIRLALQGWTSSANGNVRKGYTPMEIAMVFAIPRVDNNDPFDYLFPLFASFVCGCRGRPVLYENYLLTARKQVLWDSMPSKQAAAIIPVEEQEEEDELCCLPPLAEDTVSQGVHSSQEEVVTSMLVQCNNKSRSTKEEDSTANKHQEDPSVEQTVSLSCSDRSIKSDTRSDSGNNSTSPARKRRFSLRRTPSTSSSIPKIVEFGAELRNSLSRGGRTTSSQQETPPPCQEPRKAYEVCA